MTYRRANVARARRRTGRPRTRRRYTPWCRAFGHGGAHREDACRCGNGSRPRSQRSVNRCPALRACGSRPTAPATWAECTDRWCAGSGECDPILDGTGRARYSRLTRRTKPPPRDRQQRRRTRPRRAPAGWPTGSTKPAPARLGSGYLRTQPRRTHGASATACTASPSRCSGSDSVWATRPLHSQALNAATAAAPTMSNG